MNETVQKAFRLFFLLCFTNALGYVAATFATPDALAWYNTLPQAPFRIADTYLFIASAISYTLMAVAAFMVWNKVTPRFFALQLVCNGMWPFVLFYMHAPKGAAVILLLLLGFLSIAIKQFFHNNKKAGILLMPTLLLNSYLAYLACFTVISQLL